MKALGTWQPQVDVFAPFSLLIAAGGGSGRIGQRKKLVSSLVVRSEDYLDERVGT